MLEFTNKTIWVCCFLFRRLLIIYIFIYLIKIGLFKFHITPCVNYGSLCLSRNFPIGLIVTISSSFFNISNLCFNPYFLLAWIDIYWFLSIFYKNQLLFHRFLYYFSVFILLISAVIIIIYFLLLALGLLSLLSFSGFLKWKESFKYFFLSNVNIQYYEFPSKHCSCFILHILVFIFI